MGFAQFSIFLIFLVFVLMRELELDKIRYQQFVPLPMYVTINFVDGTVYWELP